MILFKKYWLEIKDTIKNIFDKKSEILYIVEKMDWSTKWDGFYITRELQKEGRSAKIRVTARGARNKILHFGSVGMFITQNGIRSVHPSNKKILTWFHVEPDDRRLKFVSKLNTEVDMVHTSAQTTKEILINQGLQEEKITVVPLGVDLECFRPAGDLEKAEIRTKLGIPQNAFVVGSFQKDGVGWGSGEKPKLIKGPDVFCHVMEQVNAEADSIHVLLTGPARGYVKNNLEKIGVPYTHHFLKDYSDVAEYFRALDCYVISSRAEGGPKALLEAWSSEVPLVSTNVGMVADFMKDDENGILTEVEDVAALSEGVRKVMHDEHLRETLAKNGLEAVQDFSWKAVAREYYEKIYSKL